MNRCAYFKKKIENDVSHCRVEREQDGLKITEMLLCKGQKRCIKASDEDLTCAETKRPCARGHPITTWANDDSPSKP